jgi:PAS domain S-box-containing protein
VPGVTGQNDTDDRTQPGAGRDEEDQLLAEAILGTMRQPLVVLDEDLRLQMANTAFYRTFEVDQAETEGRLIYELGNGQWDIPKLRELLEHILPNSGTVENFKVEHEFERIGRRVMMLNAHRMNRAERRDTILLAIDDITEQEHTRWLLEGEKEYAEKIVDASHDALLILGWDLRVKTANDTFYKTFHVDPSETRDAWSTSSAMANGTSRSCASCSSTSCPRTTPSTTSRSSTISRTSAIASWC